MDTLQIIEGVFLGGFIGLVLATVGAGGAILAVPGLVAFFGFSTTVATTSSLVVVGAAAFTGAVAKFRAGAADLKLGIAFSTIGVFGTFLGTYLVALVPESIVLSLFALLMIISAWTMWNKKSVVQKDSQKLNKVLVLVVASGVGAITGLLGIGGGFLIVPALVITLGINANLAVGTSLVAITTNTVLALGFRYSYWHEIPWQQVGLVAAAAVLVSAIVAPLAHKLSEVVVRRSFALLLVFVTGYVLSLIF